MKVTTEVSRLFGQYNSLFFGIAYLGNIIFSRCKKGVFWEYKISLVERERDWCVIEWGERYMYMCANIHVLMYICVDIWDMCNTFLLLL